MHALRPLLLLIVLILPSSVYAWGWDGHKLICALAEQQLSDGAREMVQQLLTDGAELKGGVVSLADACIWPDDVKYSTRKDTYEHHFLNVPDGATAIDLTRDCGALNCIAVGVQRALTYLYRDTSGDREVARRAAALRYLGHYIGDLHQPLHVSNASDWGGNKITVYWSKKKTNLHSVWDYHLLDTINIKYPASIEFLASIEVKDPGGSVLDWMNESLSLARTHAYADSHGVAIAPGTTLTDAYLERNKPIILQRMTLAANRLASLLNDIAAGKPVTVFSLGTRH